MYNKPIFTENDIWCNNPPTPGDIVKPDPDKFLRGWVYADIPTHSAFNWSGNIATHYLAHTCKYGIPEWDSQTNYNEGSIVLRFDSSSSERRIYQALVPNTNEDPLTSSSWRLQYQNLTDLVDVNITNLQDGDVINYEFITDENNKIVGYQWVNKPASTLFQVTLLTDVEIQNLQDGDILGRFDSSSTGLIWTNRSINFILSNMRLNDLYDVSVDGVSNVDDLLSYDGTVWTGEPTSGFVNFVDVYFRPLNFDTKLSDQYTIGSFRTDLKNGDELYIFSTPLGVPSKPRNLTATDNLTDKITLNWEAPNDGTADYYVIYRDDIYLDRTTDGTVLTYDDTTVETNKLYTYYVAAVNSKGESSPSNTAIGAMVDILSAPTNFSASDNLSSTAITCTWDAVPGALYYNLYKNGTIIATKIKTTTHVYITSPNQTADFCVKAYNNAGESACSNTDQGSTRASNGQKIFKTNGNFYVPDGITEVLICIQGAGGSGATTRYTEFGGGGRRGQFIQRKVSVQPGEMIVISLGAGGVPPDITTHGNGGTGGSTTVTLPDGSTITASGGTGGIYNQQNYRGVGDGIYSYCKDKIYRDGNVIGGVEDTTVSNSIQYTDIVYMAAGYGGQASLFGHGGSRTGTKAGPGAGGACVIAYPSGTPIPKYDNPEYCYGGDGIVLIAWGDNIDSILSNK